MASQGGHASSKACHELTFDGQLKSKAAHAVTRGLGPGRVPVTTESTYRSARKPQATNRCKLSREVFSWAWLVAAT